MTIGEVNNYLTNNANGKAYLADELTKEGYGQTKGGYRDKAVKEPKTWSGHASASIISTPFRLHSSLKILPTSALIFLYIIFRRYFGANTIWYLHSHVVCAKLFMSIWAKPPSVIIVRLANQHYYTSGGFFLEAEAHWEHTCIAGGLFVPSIQKEGATTPVVAPCYCTYASHKLVYVYLSSDRCISASSRNRFAR
jgi:hypothetical protein